MITMLGCRPVTMNDHEIAAGIEMGLNFSIPYDDSIKGTCAACAREVWVGPRQQKVIEKSGTDAVATYCITCAAIAAATSGKVDVQSLGSPDPEGKS